MSTPTKKLHPTRRNILSTAGGMALAAAPLGVFAQAPGKPIRVAVPQAPWYNSFERLTPLYERLNAAKVELEVSPFTGLLEKTRNAVRSPESAFDVICINSQFIPEFYDGGFIEPLHKINPKFKLQPEVVNYDNTLRWNATRKSFDAQGDVMGIPVNGNIQLLYYRTDLYAQKNLKVPTTWEALAANAKALNGGGVAGFGLRGNRGFFESSYDFYPLLASFGGDIFRTPAKGDYTVVINSPEGLRALEFLQGLSKDSGLAGGFGTLTQARIIQLMTSGKLAQAMIVTAAWPQMDDADRSNVVGKVNVAPLPAGPTGKAVTTLGHWIAAVPRNLPGARKQAGLAYLDWFQQKTTQMQYRDVGAVPVRQDVLTMDPGQDPKYRLLPAVAASSSNTRLMLPVPQAAEIADVMELQINKALIGEATAAAALNQMAQGIEAIMRKANASTGRLPDLK